MTFENVGVWDRFLRVCAGIALEYAAFVTWPTTVMSQTGVVSFVFLTLGTIALVTGLMGWCALYAVLGISTNKSVGA
jgi:Inner membrane protein YgaP-like, transmembrane domain